MTRKQTEKNATQRKNIQIDRQTEKNTHTQRKREMHLYISLSLKYSPNGVNTAMGARVRTRERAPVHSLTLLIFQFNNAVIYGPFKTDKNEIDNERMNEKNNGQGMHVKVIKKINILKIVSTTATQPRSSN